MRPRRWDVGRTAAMTLAVACVAASCGQAGFTAPPPPEFSSGQRAEPTLVDAAAADDARSEGDILLSDVEPDAEGINLDQMVMADDAGNISPNIDGWRRFDDSLERRLIPADVSASVAVMVDGEIVHQAAFGERIAGSGEAVDPTDRFRIASISKTVTSITVLRLVEAGILTMDDPVGPLLIEHLGLAAPDSDAPSITVRGLLSHTAGLAQHDGLFFSNGAASCSEAAATGLSVSVSNGSGFRYSNMNYCVLGVLIEAVTGKTYERVVDEQLLGPLGITGMRFTSTYEIGPDEVSHHPSPNRNFMEVLGAAGAWNATPSDLVTILNSIDPATPGWKALSTETMDVVRYRVPSDAPAVGYGLGVINYAGDAYGHTGTIQNAHSMVLVQPDGLTWAITVSGESPGNTGQLRSIMAAALAAGFPTS